MYLSVLKLSSYCYFNNKPLHFIVLILIGLFNHSVPFCQTKKWVIQSTRTGYSENIFDAWFVYNLMPVQALITHEDFIYKVNNVDYIIRHIFRFVCHVLFQGDKINAEYSMYYLCYKFTP
jgi:hypothetical protein